ncbi:hypothetical protein HBI25_021060 [Parastagonospora nodorum]|nr:hypothetical protein HBH51_164920 [Parastagonospora nodorum]KAH4021968.1 hypothetical protein HBI09_174510 [Parastagonospora nodorum]KAH4045414.1 hypothetical protein HBH49_203750 [Parastagonospora nodorum]KAH4073708.1 hypothetical protein HBH50_037200 [Parastagonospora nodorum]KAH4091219.1 hypothetical protein HBH48_089520 [Parastagonospora nodorum]
MMQLVAVVAFLAFSGLALANYRPVFGPEGILFSQPNIDSQLPVHACIELNVTCTSTTHNNISLYLLINSDTLPITTTVAGVKNEGNNLWEPSRLLSGQKNGLSTRTPHDELISALRDENAAPRNILRAKNEVITVQVNELRALEDELAENNGLIVGLEGKLQAHISEPSQQNIYNFYGVMKMTTPQNVDIPLPPRP